ncbi:unnamed protein product, partial [Didymodactylos carnosus]
IWSLGVILFMLVTGRAPFQEANDSETVMMILDCCYKLPSNISAECQNLIDRMIVREPEQRATLEEVMNDQWYRNLMEDDDDISEDDNYLNSLPLISHKTISNDDHEQILQEMIDGNISERELILNALDEDQYNHITATYYLLAEKLLHNRLRNDDDGGENVRKKSRKHLLPTNEPFTEQIGVFVTTTPTNYNFSDDSIIRQDSNDGDDDMSDIEEYSLTEKENVPPPQTIPTSTPRPPPLDSLSTLVQDEEERLSATASASQSRLSSARDPSTQAMNIILEEDEYC